MSSADIKKTAEQKLDIDFSKIQEETSQTIPEHITEPDQYVGRPDVSNKIVYDRILDRIYKRDLDYIGIIQGERGHGKSYGAMRMCEQMDPSFKVDRVFFKPLNLIDTMFKLYNNNKLKKGMFWVLDEGGVGWGARTWYDDSNLYMNYMAQTFRKMGQGIIITLPYLHLLDKQARRQRNAWMVAEQKGKIKYKRSIRGSDPDSKKNGKKWDVYYRTSNGEKLKYINLNLPERINTNEYEHKKDEFLYDVLGRRIKDSDVNEEEILDAFVDKAWENKEDFIVKQHINKSLIKYDLGLTGKAASYVKARLTQRLNNDTEQTENNSQPEKPTLDNETIDIIGQLNDMEKQHQTTEEEKEYIKTLHDVKGLSQGKIGTITNRSSKTVNKIVNET